MLFFLGAVCRVLRGEHSPSLSAASLLQRQQERNAAEAASTPSSQSAGDCLPWSRLWTSPDAAQASGREWCTCHMHERSEPQVPVIGQTAHQPRLLFPCQSGLICCLTVGPQLQGSSSAQIQVTPLTPLGLELPPAAARAAAQARRRVPRIMRPCHPLGPQQDRLPVTQATAGELNRPPFALV